MNTQGILPGSQFAALGRTMAAQKTGNEQTTGDDGSMSVGNLDTTFLQLLITELKSQDPMSPMDGTQMVAQMVSLNQLDQLIGIRKVLDGSDTQTTSGMIAAGGK